MTAATKIIAEALHDRDRNVRAEGLLNQRQVPMRDLILKVLGRCGNDDLSAAPDGRD
jgi:hypothetical protein